MSLKYEKLLSPLKIRNTIIRNRMGMPRAVGAYIHGVQSEIPFDSLVTFVGNMAAAGAAIVTCPGPTWDNPDSRPMQMPHFPPAGDDDDEEFALPDGASEDEMPKGPGMGKDFNPGLPNVRIILAKCAEAIHNHGSLACIGLTDLVPKGWDINEIPIEVLERIPNYIAGKCVEYQKMGFDVGNFHMSYRSSILAHSLSPQLNRRTDKYGDPAELTLSIFKRVRERCGDSFLLELQLSGEEPSGGYTTEDLAEYIKVVEPYIDIIQLRAPDNLLSHPTGLNSKKGDPLTLHYAEKLKAAGVKAILAPVGGFQDPDDNERFILEGKCDMVYMARAFLCDPNYERKLKTDCGDDITPCLKCNKCHGRPTSPEVGCSVCPELVLGIDHNFASYIRTPSRKKVAVVGGGPAGMKAAITAAQRGHSVTLYEKESKLGGQLFHADFVPFKWPVRDYRDYLISQTEKYGVEIMLNTAASKDILSSGGFDSVLVATGAVPAAIQIPVESGTEVFNNISVFGNESRLGKRVCIVGGSEGATEIGLHLAMLGHKVTVLTRQGSLASDAKGGGAVEVMREAWKKLENFSYVTRAATKHVCQGAVTYEKKGQSHIIECDSVVVCSGMTPNQDEIIGMASTAIDFKAIGDCRKVGDIRNAVKSAYTAAMLL